MKLKDLPLPLYWRERRTLRRKCADALHAFRFGHTARDQERMFDRRHYLSARRSRWLYWNHGDWSPAAPPRVIEYKLKGFYGFIPSDFSCRVEVDLWLSALEKAARVEAGDIGAGGIAQAQDDGVSGAAVGQHQSGGERDGGVEQRLGLEALGEQQGFGTGLGHFGLLGWRRERSPARLANLFLSLPAVILLRRGRPAAAAPSQAAAGTPAGRSPSKVTDLCSANVRPASFSACPSLDADIARRRGPVAGNVTGVLPCAR